MPAPHLPTTVHAVEVEGFKSLRHQRLELRGLNVLLGAHGSGKSNVLEAFRLLAALGRGRLEEFVEVTGGAGGLLWRGAGDQATRLGLRVELEGGGYACLLEPTGDDRLRFLEERLLHGYGPFDETVIFRASADAAPRLETTLPDLGDRPDAGSPDSGPREAESAVAEAPPVEVAGRAVLASLPGWQALRLRDPALPGRPWPVDDGAVLRPDGANLAAVLHRLRELPGRPGGGRGPYERIVSLVRRVTPGFEDFVLSPQDGTPPTVRLAWRAAGADQPFGPEALGEGTLRFACLATFLERFPGASPAVLVIDGAEEGLHPSAQVLLAELLHEAARSSRVISTTQSPHLVDQLRPEDVLVVELDEQRRATTLRHLDESRLTGWLESYGLGELWLKNILGARP